MKKILLIAMFYLLAIQVKGQCTFGSFPPTYTTSGGWTDHTWIAKMYTLSTTATLTGFGLHTNAVSQTQYSMALYTDNSGLPGNQIAVSGEGTMTLGQNTISISTPTIIPAGNYWIMAYYNNNGTPVTNGPGVDPIYYIYSPTGTLPVSTTTWNSSAGEIDYWAVINTPSLTISGSTVICSGSSSTLTASGAATYTWDSGVNTDTFVASATSNTSYTLTGTGSNGCSAGIITVLTVNALPTLSITGNSNVCTGSSLIETVSGASTYTWDNGATTTTVSLSPTTNTIYNVSGTDANGCDGSSSVAITVNSIPTLAITGNSSICLGTTLTLSVGGASTYTWDNGVTTNTVSLSPTTNTIYNVSGTDANGCVGTTSSAITVNALPVLSISGGSAVCTGFSVTETVSGASTYTWDNGATTTTVSLSPAASTVYVVSGTDSNGCTEISTVAITVNPLPTVSISGNTSVCPSGSLALTASGASTYSWSTGAFTNTVVISPTTTTSYTVIGTDTNGCSTLTPVSVSVYPQPVVSISGNHAVCEGESLTLTASGALIYLWINGTTTPVISLSPATNTVYSVGGINIYGCLGTATAVITVNPLPVITISLSHPVLCAGETGVITAGNAMVWLWDTGATTMSLSVSPTITTTYSVTGIDLNGCSSSTTAVQTVDNCTGLKTQSSNQTSVLVSPNPGHGLFNVTVNNLDDHSTLEIFNASGSLLKHETITSQETVINLENEANGLYYVIISTNNTRAVSKIIKE